MASLFARSVADDVTRSASRPANVVRQVDQSQDSNIGRAQESEENSNSASSLLSTLAPVALFALVWLLAFVFLRRKFARRYAPRSFISSLRTPERTPALPGGLFNWLPALFKLPDTYVLIHHSLDGYLFLRFLRICVISCIVGCCITWPVLFPVNITGGGGQRQLDMLTMSNVSNPWRYFAHAGCAWIFFGFVIFMITRESIFYINLRQAYLMSPLYAKRISSRTVLFTAVPNQYLDPAKLRSILGSHVVRIWIPTDTKELDDLVQERDKVAMKLEGAETKLITLANKARIKSIGKDSTPEAAAEQPVADDRGESGSVAGRWIKPKDRPTHRLKPLIGKKVDTINWARAELQRLIPAVEEEQHKHRILEANTSRAAFVEFDSLAEAQAAYQSLTHHQVLNMAPRYTGMIPDEVIWSNLRMRGWERMIRYAAVTAFVVALVIFWSIPVALVGAIANLNYLVGTQDSQGPLWALNFIYNLPSQLLGLITGLLPVVALAVLMALLPIILRFVAKIAGAPTLSAVELMVQNYYFAFQVVQVFLVATLGSAASSAVANIIDDPSSVLDLLSKQLPKASNFYLSYFVLQGLGVMGALLVGLVGLLITIVLSKLLDKTPRKMFKRWTSLSNLGWGTVFPIYTNLFVIALSYAVIAPLVMGFAAIGLWLFYFAYRYNILFVYDLNIDTKGLVYPRALQQLFVGLYIAQLCLVGLFAIEAGNSVGGVGPLVMMVVFLIFTALYNVALNNALGPLLNYLPKTLQAEERGLIAAEQNERNEAAEEAGVDTGATPTDAADGFPNHEKGRNGGVVAASKLAGSTPLQGAPPHKKPNFLVKFLKPHIYNDYATMRRLVPRDFANIDYTERDVADAYLSPAVTSQVPLLWVPRDGMGVSAQEVRDSAKVVPITDEGASLDGKGNIVWNVDEAHRAPLFREKVYY